MQGRLKLKRGSRWPFLRGNDLILGQSIFVGKNDYVGFVLHDKLLFSSRDMDEFIIKSGVSLVSDLTTGSGPELSPIGEHLFFILQNRLKASLGQSDSALVLALDGSR